MKSKNDFGRMIILICLGLFLVSCATNMRKGETWLNSQKDKPDIDFSGTWISSEWGVAKFKQEGREITGTVGDYPAKGVVSGSSIYLLMYWGNTVDYFAELKAVDQNTFTGIYSKWFTIDETKQMDPKAIKQMNLSRQSDR